MSERRGRHRHQFQDVAHDDEGTEESQSASKGTKGVKTRSKSQIDVEEETTQTVFEEDDEVLLDSRYIANICRLKVSLTDGKGAYALAPTYEGAWYVNIKLHVRPDDSEGNVIYNGNASLIEGYVPIAYLVALGENTVDWKSMEVARKNVPGYQGKPTNVMSENSKKLVEVDADDINPLPEEFIQDWKKHWHGVPNNQLAPKNELGKDCECYSPVRHKDGKLFFRTLGPVSQTHNHYSTPEKARKFKDTWKVILEKVWKLQVASAGGQPPRWARVNLTNPLLVHPNVDLVNTQLIKDCINGANNIKKEDDSLIEKEIERVSTAEALILKDKLDVTWKLEYTMNPPLTVARNGDYLKLSTDPFNLYTTYIHKDDWDAYMKGLDDNTDKSCRTRTFVGQEFLDPQEQKGALLRAVKSAYTQLDIKSNKDAVKVFKPQLTIKPKQDAKTANPQLDMKPKIGSAQRDTLSTAKIPAYLKQVQGGGFTLEGKLTHAKIKAAVGTRKGNINQSQTMGGNSPNDLARTFHWAMKAKSEEYKLKSNLWPAEWLHLRAYSWGGYLDTADFVSQVNTLQSPFNLVVGTSETNSVMLRYEKAWQNLFKFEQELEREIKGRANQARVAGNLWIRVNPVSSIPEDPTDNDNDDISAVEYDHYDPIMAKYRIATIRLSKNKEHVMGQDMTTDVMKAAAAEFPFIAYKIVYHVSMETHSRVFGQPESGKTGMRRTISFYPFRRPFYHQAESILDRLLITKLKGDAKEKAGIIKLASGRGPGGDTTKKKAGSRREGPDDPYNEGGESYRMDDNQNNSRKGEKSYSGNKIQGQYNSRRHDDRPTDTSKKRPNDERFSFDDMDEKTHETRQTQNYKVTDEERIDSRIPIELDFPSQQQWLGNHGRGSQKQLQNRTRGGPSDQLNYTEQEQPSWFTRFGTTGEGLPMGVASTSNAVNRFRDNHVGNVQASRQALLARSSRTDEKDSNLMKRNVYSGENLPWGVDKQEMEGQRREFKQELNQGRKTMLKNANRRREKMNQELIPDSYEFDEPMDKHLRNSDHEVVKLTQK